MHVSFPTIESCVHFFFTADARVRKKHINLNIHCRSNVRKIKTYMHAYTSAPMRVTLIFLMEEPVETIAAWWQ